MCGPLIKEETHRVSGDGGTALRGGRPQRGGVWSWELVLQEGLVIQAMSLGVHAMSFTEAA